MLYTIYTRDKPDALATRLSLYPEHRKYLTEQDTAQIIMAGPLVTDDGQNPIGSLFVIEAQSRECAEMFNSGDPFFKAGIWSTIEILAYDRKR